MAQLCLLLLALTLACASASGLARQKGAPVPGACECACDKTLAPRAVLKRALALPPAAAPGYTAALFAVDPAGAPAAIPALQGDQAPPPCRHMGKAYICLGF